MRPPPALLLASAFAVATLASPFASAQGIWIAQRSGEPALVMGKGPEESRYSPGSVTRFEGFNLAGERVNVATRSNMDQLRFKWEPELALIVSEVRPGPSTKRADGVWRRGPRGAKEEGTGYEHFRYGMHVFVDGQPPRIAQRPRLLIEPLGSLMKARVGDEVPVRVLFDGKPLAGVVVSPDYVTAVNESVRTDRDGRAVVRVRNDGLNVIVARHETEADGKVQGVDRFEFSSSLSYILPVDHDGKRQDIFKRAVYDR